MTAENERLRAAIEAAIHDLRKDPCSGGVSGRCTSPEKCHASQRCARRPAAVYASELVNLIDDVNGGWP